MNTSRNTSPFPERKNWRHDSEQEPSEGHLCGTIAANLENGLPILCTLFDYCVDQTRPDLQSWLGLSNDYLTGISMFSTYVCLAWSSEILVFEHCSLPGIERDWAHEGR
jgi:hypothetical protein